MSLSDQINEDIKAAMLAREKDKLEALRAVKSALLLIKTQEGAKPEITADEEIKLLQKLVKQRKETAEVYKTQNRHDLAEVEIFQAAIIEKYLPEQLSEEEIRMIVKAIITDTGATSVKDMGKVMGMASAKLAGKADNKLIATLVKESLGL
ncbi:MAG: GatB/YqeY domain-containing protein [Bacteroidales bacterium]